MLDAGLPACDGWTVIGELRKDGVPTAVLFLTDREAIEERVRGLELGAEDYLVESFAISELLARIGIILRRRSSRRAAASLPAPSFVTATGRWMTTSGRTRTSSPAKRWKAIPSTPIGSASNASIYPSWSP